jgi:hypothetical protein
MTGSFDGVLKLVVQVPIRPGQMIALQKHLVSIVTLGARQVQNSDSTCCDFRSNLFSAGDVGAIAIGASCLSEIEVGKVRC